MKRLSFWLIMAFIVAGTGAAYAAAAETTVSDVAYDAGGRRDPFLPLVGENGILKYSSDSSEILVEGIIFDPVEGSMALINGEFYKQGDTVGDANIISIFQDRVILEQDDEEKTMWIREEIINKG